LILDEEVRSLIKQMKRRERDGVAPWQAKVEEWLFEDDIMGCKVKSGECVCIRPIVWTGPESPRDVKILETIPEEEAEG
jgi:hypothetical protein